MSLVTKYFTSNGTWVCPAGVTRVMLVGAGGGGGGGQGKYDTPSYVGGGGGGGSAEMTTTIPVVPNTSYSITIGSGGIGSSTPDTPGGSGGDTTFGALATFTGAGGGEGATAPNFRMAGGTYNKAIRGYHWDYTGNYGYLSYQDGNITCGKGGSAKGNNSGFTPNSQYVAFGSTANALGYSGGTNGTGDGGGGGGGGGPKGVGANGSNADLGAASSNGGNAAANTGAGGGGSGAGNPGTQGNGGNGGSGYLYVIFEDG